MAKTPKVPKPQSPPPDAEYVEALYQMRSREGDESRLRDLATSFRLLTRMEHKISVPPAYQGITKVVRTPFIRDAWQRITAALTQKPPVVHLEPRDEREDSRRAANLAERWDTALFEELNRRLGLDLVFESTKALVRDGESVIKVVHRPDAWANFPARERGEDAKPYNDRVDRYKKESGAPFAWRVVDRLQMLFGDGEFGDDWALEYGEYPAPYLGRRYRMVLDRNGRLVDPAFMLGGMPKPEAQLVTAGARSIKLEYFDAEWWAVVIDGTMAPGFPKPNPYAPRLPYLRAKSSDSESLLYSLLFLGPTLDQLLTMKMNWAYLGAFATPMIESVPNAIVQQDVYGEDNQPTKLTWRPGKLIEIPVGKRVVFLAPPPIGQDLNEMVVVLRTLIDIAGVPSVFRGVGGPDQAGYAINQLMAAASLAFKVASISLQRQIEQVLDFCHWLIPNRIGQTVYVMAPGEGGKQYLGLSPKGNVTTSEAPVTALGPISVTFRPVLPTDEQARAMVATQLVNAPIPLMSQKGAIEKYLQEEDAEGIVDDIYIERALEEEPLRSMVVQRALEAAGLLPPPTPPANPLSALVGPNGQPILPAGIPGQAAGGLPMVPGLNLPLVPPAPGGVPIQTGGRAPGSFPGLPPSQPGNIPVVGP